MIPTLLNFALPLATSYAEEQETKILQDGVPLTEQQCSDAKQLGIQNPGRIRLMKVPVIPTPTQPVLAKANEYVGMIGPQSATLSYGYGAFIRADLWEDRAAIVHELVHVAQQERLGGINAFLKAYLKECLTVGHDNSPMEKEAVTRTKEICG